MYRHPTDLSSQDADGVEGHDQYVYQHSNHNCIIGVAETHPLVREGKTVTHVNFKPDKLDHMNMQVRGKTKKVKRGRHPTALLLRVLTARA